ncbi:gluconate 2-dehydrogenase subunit 3 family protein [Egicoccus sp. AB-alg6-2]|uniref:gluconate 2-dehydrogenase subunit 3 family protein n=1 Tax=Egicoccus sp. AB-alg6-2 TaxID=3242692 RepID=UPI00359DCAFD
MAQQERPLPTSVQTGADRDPADERPERSRLSRRSFLAVTGTLATAAVVPGCTTGRGTPAVPQEGPSAAPQPGLDVAEAATGDRLGRFLDPQQIAIVAAIAARVIPGDADDPGAVEAGAVEYIDRLLATHESYPQRTYTQRPFAQTYEGDTEPPPEPGVIWVREDQLDRYGWQSGIPPREIYRMGLPRLDALAEQRHGSAFAELGDDDQDALLRALEDDEDDDVGELFDEVPASTFFDLVRGHVVEGFLADPVYGGNRDLVGWEHIGFPGSQRGYSPQELLDPNFSRPPQGLAQLPMMHGAHREDDHHDHGGAALGSIRRRHPNGPLD